MNPDISRFINKKIDIARFIDTSIYITWAENFRMVDIGIKA